MLALSQRPRVRYPRHDAVPDQLVSILLGDPVHHVWLRGRREMARRHHQKGLLGKGSGGRKTAWRDRRRRWDGQVHTVWPEDRPGRQSTGRFVWASAAELAHSRCLTWSQRSPWDVVMYLPSPSLTMTDTMLRGADQSTVSSHASEAVHVHARVRRGHVASSKARPRRHPSRPASHWDAEKPRRHTDTRGSERRARARTSTSPPGAALCRW